MRILSFIFIVVLAAAGVSAQTSLTGRSFEEGVSAARDGRFEQALEKFEKARLAAENEKTNVDLAARIYFNIGVCLYRTGRSDEAVTALERAVALGGADYQKAFYVLGMAHVELKNPRAAIEAFRRAVALKKSDAEAWFDLGMALVEEKDYRAALEAFKNSVRYQTVSKPDAHNNIGVLFALEGDFASAEKQFKTALLESGGRSVEARNNLEFCKLYKPNALKTIDFRFSRHGG